MDKIKYISLMFLTGSDSSPDTLTPAHASISAGALSYSSINNHWSVLSLSSIIGRFNFRLGQKSEIILRSFTIKSPGQFLSKFMIRWSSHSFQKAGFNSFHQTNKTFGSEFISTVQCIKQLFEPFKQFTAPAGKFFNFVLGKETNLSNQMSHAIRHR